MGSALPRIGIPSSAEAYTAMLEGLAELDQLILREQPLPPLYNAGVKYKNEPHNVIRHADDVAREGWGDCEDLSGYRVAELRNSGEDPGASIAVYKTGPSRFHAVVRRGSGVIEDPSKVLGMPIRDEAKYKAKLQAAFPDAQVEGDVEGDDGPQVIIGDAEGDRSLSFDIYHTGRGWSGVIKLPLLDGRALFMSSSNTPEKGPPSAASTVEAKLKAAGKAMNMAKSLASNPAVKALLPPQAQMALQVIQSPAAKAALQAGAAVAKKLKFW